MSAPPLPEVFGNYALKDFAEVVPPDALSWLPQTVGWLWVAIALAGLALFQGWKKLRRWYRDRYRREGIARLRQLAAETPPPGTLVAEINKTLKLVAMAGYSRPAVASLSGSAWTDFLLNECDQQVFNEDELGLLATAGYREVPLPPGTDHKLLDAGVRWISEHRGRYDA